jgi:hypothetical protein
MAEAVRDFHGKSALFSAAFLEAAGCWPKVKESG